MADRVTSITRPNGTVRTMTYNAAGETLKIQETTAGGLPVALFNLGYDTAGRISTEFMAPIPTPYTETAQTITYDADNRIATFNATVVTHDADGNMTSGPLNSNTAIAHTYDARNRLTSVGVSGAAPALSYTYNAEGQRTGITRAGQTTTFAIDPSGLSKVLIRTKPDLTKTYYVYGLGLIYESDGTANTRNYHYDYRGSTVALTDQTGVVKDRVEYSTYGRITKRTGTTDTPFLYNGRYGVMTDANGLVYMRARYYNTFLRRFINADPSGSSGGLNFYAYADGNPISLLDPFGLSPWTSAMGGLRAVGGIFEAAAGYTVAVASGTAAVGTSPTVVGAVGFGALAVGGAAVGAHGIDQFQAGIQQLWTGEHVESLTSQNLQAAGMSPRAANIADASISIVGSLGAGFGTTAIRATQLSATSISADVVNASLLTKVGYYEVGQLSLNGDAYRYYSLWGNTLDRGAAMVADQGGGVIGWGRAMGQGSAPLGWREGTLTGSLQSAWPTPLGAGGVGAIGGVANWGGK